jgi:hypothetical protein
MHTDLPPILESKLADFRKRVWIVKLLEGLLAGIFGFALSYVLVFALDRVMETPAWVRATLLALGAAVPGLGLPLKWHRWVWRQRSLEDAARLLRRKFPRLGDQLLGIVELAHFDDGNASRSEALVRAAMAQAADAVKGQDFSHAVPEARHGRWAFGAIAILVLVTAAAALVPAASRNALARWITPWRDVERYTFAKVEQLPDKLVVPYAEPFDVDVTLRKDTEWSPQQGTARIPGQPKVRTPLEGGGYELAFPPQKGDTPMHLSVGDVRKTVEVQPRQRPELASLTATLRLPEYLKYKSEPRQEVRSGSVSVLKGAQASFTATASRPLASAEVDGQPVQVADHTLTTNYKLCSTSTETRFSWRDVDGLAPREPLLLKINAIEDEPPRLSARREAQEQVVLDTEVVAFDLAIDDDFGVRRTGLQWQGVGINTPKDRQAKGEKTAAAGEPEKRSMETRATFCAAREGIAPQSLEVRAWAEDYLPDRERTLSPSFVLHVLSKEDHALWLTEQFGKWLHVARESYEREQQLHEANRELRALSAAELDRPENRRRVSEQAAAERANSDRLDAISDAGKNLVEQATKNPEFDAARLETWATMLKSLRDIASKRMPSVAELLKQSSSSAAGKSGQPQTAQNNPQGSKPSDPNAKPQSAKPGDNQAQAQNPNQNQNSSEKKSGEGQPGESKPSAPTIAQGPTPPPGAPKPAAPKDPNAKPKDPAPSIVDREGSFSKPPPQEADPNAKPKPPSQGGLTLPTTQMAAAPSKPKEKKEGEEPETPAQEKLSNALQEQRDLLAEFAKVADQLREVLASLEASTFVKRLKLASRKQMDVAKDLNTKTLDAFGLDDKKVPQEPAQTAAGIAAREAEESQTVRIIQSDLDAFFQRRSDMRFKNILDQMKKAAVVDGLAKLGAAVRENYSGQSISGAEFWADSLDRWAEELVAASNCECKGSGDGDSLPPEIVLKVMQILRDEMQLRDETREAENSKPAVQVHEHRKRSFALSNRQGEIARNTRGAREEVLMLDNGGQRFGKVVRLLSAVSQVMDEATLILEKPDTGSEAIAAETEAIELLLQARRPNPKGGGGGGDSPGGGGSDAAAAQAALAELGPGSAAETKPDVRPVGQSTGKAGRQFPEEFKAGLDAFFNALEGKGAE